MWSLKTPGMEALAGYWALENPVADRLQPRFRDHLEFLVFVALCETCSCDKMKLGFSVCARRVRHRLAPGLE